MLNRIKLPIINDNPTKKELKTIMEEFLALKKPINLQEQVKRNVEYI